MVKFMWHVLGKRQKNDYGVTLTWAPEEKRKRGRQRQHGEGRWRQKGHVEDGGHGMKWESQQMTGTVCENVWSPYVLCDMKWIGEVKEGDICQQICSLGNKHSLFRDPQKGLVKLLPQYISDQFKSMTRLCYLQGTTLTNLRPPTFFTVNADLPNSMPSYLAIFDATSHAQMTE